MKRLIVLFLLFAVLGTFAQTQPSEGLFQLDIHGPLGNHNTLGLTVNGVVWYICGDQGWEKQAADVVCRQLNYDFGHNYTHHISMMANDTGPPFTSIISCSGSETDLGQCQHTALNASAECPTEQVAAISCYHHDQPNVDFRLNSKNGTSGGVQVYLNNTWVNMCDTASTWFPSDVEVVCRSLGFANGSYYQDMDRDQFADNSLSWWSFWPTCTGDEQNIMDCSRRMGFLPGCQDEQHKLLTVTCVPHENTTTVSPTTGNTTVTVPSTTTKTGKITTTLPPTTENTTQAAPLPTKKTTASPVDETTHPVSNSTISGPIEEKKDLIHNIGAIVGIAVGSVLVVVAFFSVLVFLRRRRTGKTETTEFDNVLFNNAATGVSFPSLAPLPY